MFPLVMSNKAKQIPPVKNQDTVCWSPWLSSSVLSQSSSNHNQQCFLLKEVFMIFLTIQAPFARRVPGCSQCWTTTFSNQIINTPTRCEALTESSLFTSSIFVENHELTEISHQRASWDQTERCSWCRRCSFPVRKVQELVRLMWWHTL